MFITQFNEWNSSKLILLPCLLLASLLLESCSSEQTVKQQLENIALEKKGKYPIKTKHLDADANPIYTNRLIRQDSLYLLQHAHNPVNWFSWSDQAFEHARKEDKPILLSIGYSTCHWCHVMERESFEDPAIAAYLNENYIAIKVDREERPDIDELYLTAVQMLSGKAGWPLTVVLTPDAKPFFGGTYFAPEQFLSKLTQINTTWLSKRAAVDEQAERLHTALNKLSKKSASAKLVDAQLISNAATQISRDMKLNRNGPLSGFPREPEMLFLLQNAKLNLDPIAIAQINKRLTTIINGGIYDQLGGGFHRYTVDADWQIPHFEKMLYNQAQMSEVLLSAYLLSGNVEFLNSAIATLDFVLRDMQHPQGGFYSAMDAESGGEEGGFYLWSMKELTSLLSSEELLVAQQHYGVSASGNFNNKNILHLTNAEASEQVAPLKQTLLTARAQRTAPKTDTKRITAWNGLMINSFISGYQATHKSDYLEAATKAAQVLWQTAYSTRDGLARVVHSSAQGNAQNRIDGVLDDYANYATALISLYDQMKDPVWLQRSETVANQMIDKFYNEESGAFNTSSHDQDKNLLVQIITARDDALNSGNSIATQVLLRLFKRTGDTRYKKLATSVLAAFSKQLIRNPQSLSGMLAAASLLQHGEVSQVHYAAKNKVRIRSEIVDTELQINIDIDKGWHINSHRVLEGDLIATKLSSKDTSCPRIHAPSYPQDKTVTLGFQDDELIVYEGATRITAQINNLNGNDCRLVSTHLRLQACSNQVCLQPESIEIRTPLH